MSSFIGSPRTFIVSSILKTSLKIVFGRKCLGSFLHMTVLIQLCFKCGVQTSNDGSTLIFNTGTAGTPGCILGSFFQFSETLFLSAIFKWSFKH